MITITGLSSIRIQLEGAMEAVPGSVAGSRRAGTVWGHGAEPPCSPYLSIRSELELVFAGSPDWVCCFSCDLANFSAAAMGHPDKLWELVGDIFLKEKKKRE